MRLRRRFPSERRRRACGPRHARLPCRQRGAGGGREELGLDGVECITLHAERLIEEAPLAYKAIDPVIDVQVEAGIVKAVARMRPLLTFKA